MAFLKCKMCGGDLNVTQGQTVCECVYCGTRQTVPSLDNEKKIALFTRANRLRSLGEFDKAFGVYESIVTDFPEEAEAYWGLILCKYGIEYIDDPATGKKVPTCHRTSFNNVLEDSDFEMVMKYADVFSRAEYRAEAKEIEQIRNGIIEVSSKEDPYDIFICYKETDDDGNRTLDSVIAQDVYTVLTEKGYRVFFSRISLEDKLGQEYEPYIFAALHSAKIMLAFGTSYDYYNAVWVKNEWSRFLALIAKGEKKTLIPCYKGIDAYDMPQEFRRLQAQDMGKVGAVQDLIRGVDKIIGTAKTVVGDSTIDELIEDKRAREVQQKKTKRMAIIIAAAVCVILAAVITVFLVQRHQQKLQQQEAQRQQEEAQLQQEEAELQKNEERYNEAVETMRPGTFYSYLSAYSKFYGIKEYKDSADLANKCRDLCFAAIYGIKLEGEPAFTCTIYEDGTCVINGDRFNWEFDDVNSVPSVRIKRHGEEMYSFRMNSWNPDTGDFLAGLLVDKSTGLSHSAFISEKQDGPELSDAEKEKNYLAAQKLFNARKYSEAIELYNQLGDYKDSAEIVASSGIWSVVGSMKGSDWANDIPMYPVSDDTYTTESIEMKKGDEFKIRKDRSWDINYGRNGLNGYNFVVNADGQYVIIFNEKTETASIEPVS